MVSCKENLYLTKRMYLNESKWSIPVYYTIIKCQRRRISVHVEFVRELHIPWEESLSIMCVPFCLLYMFIQVNMRKIYYFVQHFTTEDKKLAFRLFSTNHYIEPEDQERDPGQRCLWSVVIKAMR